MMYFVLTFAALTAVFGGTVWQWLRMNPVMPLSPLPEYRPVLRSVTAPPVFAASAMTATFLPGHVWRVPDPRDVVYYGGRP